MLEICSDLFKTCLKIYYFCQHSKKAKKWPNGQTIFFWPTVSKRPNNNPDSNNMWQSTGMWFVEMTSKLFCSFNALMISMLSDEEKVMFSVRARLGLED
jgi:hypothetical protein